MPHSTKGNKKNIFSEILKQTSFILIVFIVLSFLQTYSYFRKFDLYVSNFSSPYELLFDFVPSFVITPITSLFIILSNYYPFIAIIYLRKGANNYDGLTKREWKIFLISWVIGNLYWSSVVVTGVKTFQYIINLF